MDFNTTAFMSKGVAEGLLAGFLYDVFSIMVAFVLVKILYEMFYMKYRWGNWKIKVTDSSHSNFEGAERSLTPSKAKEILEDEGEFSVYAKGVVSSTNSWLNIDIASKKAKEIGLVKIDEEKREICIDLAKNHQKKKAVKSVKFDEKTKMQIDHIESILQELKKDIKQDKPCTSSSPTTSPMTSAEEL